MNMISIFSVIFGQNLDFRPPGVPILRFTPNCYVFDVEKIPSRSILNVFYNFLLSNSPGSEVTYTIPIFCLF
jgi:hypothetical protein